MLFVLNDLDGDGSSHNLHELELASAVSTIVGELSEVFVLQRAKTPIVSTSLVKIRYLPRVGVARFPLLAMMLVRSLMRQRLRAVHVRISVGGLLSALAARALIDARVSYWHATWKPGIPSATSRSERIFRWAIVRADLLITFPAFIARYYETEYRVDPSSICLIPNCISSAYVGRASRTIEGVEPIDVLFVGRLSKRKGAHDLEQLSRELNGRCPGLRFEVVGDGPIRLDGSRIRAVLHGETSNAKVPEFMERSRVVVIPSYAEACSRVLQEAMSMGCIPVAYRIPPVAEMLGDLADDLTVEVGDVCALASRVAELLQDKDTRGDLVAELLRISKSFWPDVVARQLVECVQR